MYPHFKCFSSTVCQCYKFIFQTSIIVDKRSLQSSVKNFVKENTLCILKQQILPGIIWMLLYMYVWCTFTHNNQCVNKRGEKQECTQTNKGLFCVKNTYRAFNKFVNSVLSLFKCYKYVIVLFASCWSIHCYSFWLGYQFLPSLVTPHWFF